MSAPVVTIVHCWSSPRSRSTALLYSFESRGDDTVAIDESLYRRWLREKIGAASCGNGGGGGGGGGDCAVVTRPYAEALLRGSPPDGDVNGGDDDDDSWRWERERKSSDERVYDAVRSIVIGGGEGGDEDGDGDHGGGGVVFLKQMAKFSHLFDFDANWEKKTCGDECNMTPKNEWREKCSQLLLDAPGGEWEIRHRHLLLIRDPMSVLSSWMGKSGSVHGNNPHPDEVGITQLSDVYSRVLGSSMNRCGDADGGVGGEDNNNLVVIDSDDLASNPRVSLREICDAFGIEYRDSMLNWSRGPHACDGPWGA